MGHFVLQKLFLREACCFSEEVLEEGWEALHELRPLGQLLERGVARAAGQTGEGFSLNLLWSLKAKVVGGSPTWCFNIGKKNVTIPRTNPHE